jgi:FG-GAP repeat protein
MSLWRVGIYMGVGLIVSIDNYAVAKFGDQLWRRVHADALTSIDADDGVVIVGSYTSSPHAFRSGSAFFFNATSGASMGTITPSDGGDHDYFGWSVAIESGFVVVGAPWDADRANYAGSAYVFDMTTHRFVAKLDPSGDYMERVGDQFGYSVGVSANHIIVGAVYDDGPNGALSGGTYTYDLTGSELARMNPGGGSAFSPMGFGHSVSIDGDIAVVGGHAGDARVINLSTNSILRTLKVWDATSNEGFGRSVALDGRMALVGAQWDDDQGTDSGSAYVIDIDTGSMISKLIPNDGSRDDEFGEAVAIENGLALVGARYNGLTGAAYLFDALTGKQLAKLVADNPQLNDGFGSELAISDGIAYVLSPWNGSGQIYAFDVARVPEPTTVLLAMCSLSALSIRRVRRHRSNATAVWKRQLPPLSELDWPHRAASACSCRCSSRARPLTRDTLN